MNAALVLIVSIVILLCGYVFYGKWLAEQWGVDPKRTTPAYEMRDGVDYVPAKTPVLMGHHFSSIAGAGPINGPIQAAAFGWVPVLLWVLIGGVFFGGVHDYGALFASLRHQGQSIGEVIEDAMGNFAKKIFIIFGYLTLLLVVAAFSSIVASTFGSTTAAGIQLEGAALLAHQQTAMISLLFIVLAIIFGILVYRKNVPVGTASVIGVIGIVIIVAIGMNFCPISLSYNTWMWVLAIYIMVASVTPVWILLQPRDYLSSFLLYFSIAVAFIAIIGASFAGQGHLDIPAFAGWQLTTSNGLFAKGSLFPALFVTIACGAISGFHSLVSSGTTSKQLENESNARPVAYGSMLIECIVAVISVCAVGFVWHTVNVDKEALAATGLTSPTAVFAGGISRMIGTFVGADSAIVGVIYSMFVLAVSVFCLTSLDTATRLARYMFQEFWLAPDETVQTVTGTRKFLCNPYFATIVTVVLGVGLGMTGYAKIWPLFGAANQLLAAVGLLAVCTWLGKVGRNNRMFHIPMVFMLIVTICSLIQTIMGKISAIEAGGADIWAYIQAAIAALLILLALVLAVYSFANLAKQKEQKAKA